MDRLSTEHLELDVEQHADALRAMDGQDGREQVTVTRSILRYQQETQLALKREILQLRQAFREAYAAAWDSTDHPVNVAKKHAREVLRKVHAASEVVEQHDHDEEW
jgi:hypothetical protein